MGRVLSTLRYIEFFVHDYDSLLLLLSLFFSDWLLLFLWLLLIKLIKSHNVKSKKKYNLLTTILQEEEHISLLTMKGNTFIPREGTFYAINLT